MTDTAIKIEDLPTVYDPKATEESIYKFWEEGGFFKADAKSKKPPYSIVIPPPNVTGVLHMGHALDETLQDILTRYHRMAGFETLWLQELTTPESLPKTLLKKNFVNKGFHATTLAVKSSSTKHGNGQISINPLS